MSTEPSEKNPMAWLHEDRPESGVITDREKRSQYFRTDKYSIPLYEFQQDTKEARAQENQVAEPVAYAIEIDGVVHNIGFDKRSLEIVARQVYGRTLQIRPLVFGDAVNKQRSDR